MNKLNRTILTLAAAAALWAHPCAAAAAQSQDKAEVALKAAMDKEVIDGDLKAAIDQYAKLAKSTNRAVAAQALLRLGQCYEKLGNRDARQAYERLVKEFGDQKAAVATAQARLAVLGRAGSGAVYRQVLAGSETVRGGRVSADGRYLSFTDWETGDLAVHDFVTGRNRLLTNKGSWDQSDEFADHSAISADGKQVAYAWWARGPWELRIVNVGASGFPAPRRLPEQEDVAFVGPYDWSPDGQWLAVTLLRKSGVREIGLVSTQDGSLRVLKSGGSAYPTQLFFSPDGKHLGFDLPTGSSVDRDLIVAAVDGSGEFKAVADPGQAAMMGWSPDGKRLLFASDRSGGTGLWAVSIANGKPQGPPELIRAEIARWSLGVTASGTLYVSASLSNRDVHIASLDFDTGKLLSPPVRPAKSFIGSNMQPDWSPDGKSLAYVSSRGPAGANRVLAVHSVGAGQVRELRPALRTFNNPRWAPDGRSFVVQGRDPQDRQGLFRVDAATAEVTAIAFSQPGGQFGAAQWSPDGKKIYYLSNIPDTASVQTLIERDLSSGTERELIRRAYLGNPSVLPDGRHIAIRAGALLLIPVAGGEPRELLRVNAPESLTVALTCTPDGRGLLVQRMLAKGSELLLVPVDGGQPRKLDNSALDFWSAQLRIHPDGRQIAYVAGESKSEIWALENFLPAK